VAANWVNLRNNRDVGSGLGDFNGSPESGESSADNQDIMFIHKLASCCSDL
jgi:hypothetical protein